MEHNPVGVNVFSDEERQRVVLKALDLRLRGKSYADIGDELGVSSGQAWLYVTNELKKRAKETGEKATEIITLEVQRLDKILEVLWPRVEAGSLDHMETYLRVAQRRAKLLGLDAASKQKIEVTDNRRQLSDEEAYKKFRALQERLAKAGFKPHPVLSERNPFEALEGEVVSSELVKVPAGARHSDQKMSTPSSEAPLPEPNFDKSGPRASNSEQNDTENEDS